MNLLARRFGKATASLMMSKGKEMFMEDFNEKNENWNNRMNNFARNLNRPFQTTKNFKCRRKECGKQRKDRR